MSAWQDWVATLTPDQAAALRTEVEIARDARVMAIDFSEFVRGAWATLEPGRPLLWNWHLTVVCAYLEAVHARKIRRLLVNIPPGSMKSLLVSVLYPAWVWINEPTHRFLCGSNEGTLATRDALRMRALIESNWFRERWPDITLAADQREKTLFQNNRRGHRESQGVLAKITGKRGDCLAAGTMVATELGDIPIERFCSMEQFPRVWSMTISGRLELRKVMAARKLWSRRVITVSAYSGHEIQCTPDHLIWVGNGYEKAESVSGRSVSILQRADKHKEWRGYSMPIMCAHSDAMRNVWKIVSKGMGRAFQASARRHQGRSFLQQNMPQADAQPGASGSFLRGVWITISAMLEKVVASPLLQGVRGYFRQVCSSIMRVVRRAIHGGKLTTSILFDAMRVAGARLAHERKREPKICANADTRWPFSADEAIDSDERQASLLFMQQPTDRACIAGSSHRRGLQKQRCEEPDHAVCCMPHKNPQVEECRADVIQAEGSGGEPQPVYDIQVEGNHNFFANGILVHNCLIWDDPHDTRQTDSDALRGSILDAWDMAWSSRLNDLDASAVIIIMQRIHQKDITGHLLAKRDQNWVQLAIPMRYDPDMTFDAGRDIGRPDLVDPRTEPGELLFPERFSERAVRELESDLGPYGTAGQLQQRPAPKGGGEMKREWLMRYRNKPIRGNKVILVDPAGERKPGAGKRDNSAMGVFLIGEDNNIYLIDAYRDRLNLTERADILFDWHRTYRPLAVGYERYGMQTDIAHLRDRMEREQYRFPVIELGGSMAKEDRIRRLIPLLADGRIWLPEHLYRTTTDGQTVDLIERFIEEEYLPFPVAGRDDFFDMMSRLMDAEIMTKTVRPRETPRVSMREHVVADRHVGY